jgi:hypothetical protein
MGSLTLTQLQTELNSAHASRTDFTEARRIVALNLAQTRIARLYDWNELQALDTGTIGDAASPATDKFEAVPSNIRRMYSFRIVDTASKSNSRKLTWVPQRQWDQNVPETEAWVTDTPVMYTIWKRTTLQFEFWKIPDQSYNYEIRSAKWPTDFATASPNATSDLDNKDDMIIALAASWGFLTFREMDEADKWWKIYRNMANDALGQDIEEYEIDIRAPLEQAIRGRTPGPEPWLDPFNRTGVE